MKIYRKISLYAALFLCAMLILVGLAILGSDFSVMQRLVLFALCAGSGVALGAICFALMKEE